MNIIQHETNEQKRYRLNRDNYFKQLKELNNKMLSMKNIIYKPKYNLIDVLTKEQKAYIDSKIKNNELRKEIKRELLPEFINLSSLKPENKLLIKQNLGDIYTEGDIVDKKIVDLELQKIDDEFKKNLLTIMNLKDYDIVNNSNFFNVDGSIKKRYININFLDLKEKLKEKYVSLDVNEFLFFIQQYYKDPKNLIKEDDLKNKMTNFRNLIKKKRNNIIKRRLELEAELKRLEAERIENERLLLEAQKKKKNEAMKIRLTQMADELKRKKK
jgi:hypothetical protein